MYNNNNKYKYNNHNIYTDNYYFCPSVLMEWVFRNLTGRETVAECCTTLVKDKKIFLLTTIQISAQMSDLITAALAVNQTVM